MAVKPITNKQSVNTSAVDRSEQRSFKNFKNRGQRKAASQIPGKDFTKNYAITLKDLDSSVINHVKNVVTPIIKSGTDMIKVPVLYGNQERWVSARKLGYIRDRNGSLMLPLIVLRRTDIAKNTTTQQAFTHDIKHENVAVVRNSKWSKQNRYTRFSVLNNIHPVYENVITGPATYVDVTYDFILWTNYIEQMNSLTELFIEHNDTYWGDSEDYKFFCNTESFADASELDIDGERVIKTNFSISLKGYLLSEVISSVITDKKFQIEVRPSPRKVIFGTETTIEQQNTAGGGSIRNQSKGTSHANKPPHSTPKGAKSAIGSSPHTDASGQGTPPVGGA